MYVCVAVHEIHIIFMHIHINLFRGNHMVHSCITDQDISMHCSVFYILITLPNRFEGTDVLCTLTPWTDLTICQTGVHAWTFQAEKFLRALWNVPGAYRWNEKVLELRNTLFKQHLRCVFM